MLCLRSSIGLRSHILNLVIVRMCRDKTHVIYRAIQETYTDH